MGSYRKGKRGIKKYMKITIIVPANNRVKNIRETLHCLTKQDIFGTGHETQFILVDDDSTDGTGEMMEMFQLPNKTVIHRKNRGKWNASIPRNMAAKESWKDSQLLYFLDSDVLLPPDRLRRLVEVWHENNDDDPNRVIIGQYHFMRAWIDTRNDPLWYEKEMTNYDGDIRSQSFIDHPYKQKNKGLGFALACFGGSLAVPRKLFFKAGGFDETMLSGVEDGDFGLTLWETGAVFSLDSGLLGWHNPHPILPERTQYIRECVDRLNAKHNVDIIKITGEVHRQWGLGEWEPPKAWIEEGGYTLEEVQ